MGIQTFDGKGQTGYCVLIRGPQLNREQQVVHIGA
jgi:hypothetical protein